MRSHTKGEPLSTYKRWSLELQCWSLKSYFAVREMVVDVGMSLLELCTGYIYLTLLPQLLRYSVQQR